MQADADFYTQAIVSVLVITDPITRGIFFKALTEGEPRRRRPYIRTITITVAVVLGIAALAGREILDLLGIILGAIFLFFRQGVVNAIQAITGQNLWDPSVRFLTELPSKTDPFEVAAIVLVALILSFLATLYPAYKAAGTDPVQVLRYE